MSQISSNFQQTREVAIRAGRQPAPVHPQRDTPVPQPADRAQLSEAARFMSRLRQQLPVRAERVAAVRALIEAGSYETPARIEAAIDRLAADLR